MKKDAYRNFNFTSLNLATDVRGGHTFDGATHRRASSEDLANSSRKILGKRTVTNLAGNLDDLIESKVSVVLNVLLLLTITRWLLQSLDNVTGSGGLNFKSGLNV